MDPTERESALKINELPASFLISGMNSICEVAEVKPLSKVEKDEGTTAVSALLYEYGANVSAGVLMIMWIAGVVIPRVVEYLRKKKEEEKRKELEQQAPKLPATAAAPKAA